METTYNHLNQKWEKSWQKEKRLCAGRKTQFRLIQNNKPGGLENVCSNLCNTSFDSENFVKNEGKKTPDLEEYSLAVESQISEEYDTEVSKQKCERTKNGKKSARSPASVQKRRTEKNRVPVKECTISSLWLSRCLQEIFQRFRRLFRRQECIMLIEFLDFTTCYQPAHLFAPQHFKFSSSVIWSCRCVW